MEKSFAEYLKLKNPTTLDDFEKQLSVCDKKELISLIIKALGRKNSRVIYKCLLIFDKFEDPELLKLFFDNLKTILKSILNSYCPPPLYYNKARDLFLKIIDNNYEKETQTHPRLKMTYHYLMKTYSEFIDVVERETTERLKFREMESNRQKFHQFVCSEMAVMVLNIDSTVAVVESIFNEYFYDFSNSNERSTKEFATGITKSLNLNIVVDNSTTYTLTRQQSLSMAKCREELDFNFIPQLKFYLLKVLEIKVEDSVLIESIQYQINRLRAMLTQMTMFNIQVETLLTSDDDDEFEDVVIPKKRIASPDLILPGRQRRRLDTSGMLG